MEEDLSGFVSDQLQEVVDNHGDWEITIHEDSGPIVLEKGIWK